MHTLHVLVQSSILLTGSYLLVILRPHADTGSLAALESTLCDEWAACASTKTPLAQCSVTNLLTLAAGLMSISVQSSVDESDTADKDSSESLDELLTSINSVASHSSVSDSILTSAVVPELRSHEGSHAGAAHSASMHPIFEDLVSCSKVPSGPILRPWCIWEKSSLAYRCHDSIQ